MRSWIEIYFNNEFLRFVTIKIIGGKKSPIVGFIFNIPVIHTTHQNKMKSYFRLKF